MKRVYFLLSLLLTIIFFVISCQKKASEPTKKPAPLIPGSLIFLDTSMSMRGYFRVKPATGTTIQRFMLADLFGILAEENFTPAYLSLFGSKVTTPERIQSLRQWSFFESQKRVDNAYSQIETNLIDVFENEKFGKYNISIVITDGTQSSMEGSKNIAGFDTRIFKVIKDIRDKGIHLWLIGIKSEFRGIIYPERPCPDGAKKCFDFSGRRPIYIWIGSPDANIGHNLIEKMVNSILKIESSKDFVKVVGLTSIKYPFINIELETHKSSSPIKPIKPKEISEKSFEYLLAKTKESSVDIPINIFVKKIDSHLYDFDWKINLELDPKNISWAKLIKEDNGWKLKLLYDLIPGSSIFGCNSSKGYLNLIANAIPSISSKPWWNKWSTDDDSRLENVGKTLYLSKLSDIIENPLRKKYEIEKIIIKIKKP